MAATTDTTDARQGEYVTFAPAGEKCAFCRQEIKALDRVWRLAVDRPSGPPAPGPYRHYGECPGKAA